MPADHTAPGSGEGEQQGATPLGSGHPSSTEPLAGLGPAGGSPSRDPLVAFAKEIIAAGWNAHLDEEFVHRASLRFGLVSETIYDPAIHGSSDVDAEPGDPWFVFSGSLAAPGVEARRAKTQGGLVEDENPIAEGEALANTSPDPSPTREELQAEIDLLRTALAESERKQGDILAMLKPVGNRPCTYPGLRQAIADKAGARARPAAPVTTAGEEV